MQAPQPNGNLPGILWLENAETDGFMLRANGIQSPVNGYQLRLDGFASLGIRTDGTNGMQNIPSRSRLHLIDVEGEVEAPWRPYYRNGTLLSGNQDMGYVGHRYYDDSHEEPWNYTRDHSDLLISAGEDIEDMEDPLRQRIRFTYTTTPDPLATVGAATYAGLEFMQLWPWKPEVGFVGIGDFTHDNSDPTEMLDVLDRTIRIQDLVPDYFNNDLTKVVMTDNDGRLHWKDITTFQAADCEWLMYDNPGPNHVYTATGAPDPDCPDDLEFVGIGTPTPDYKLDVEHTRSTSGSIGGIRSTYFGSATGSNDGINSVVGPENGTNIDFASALSGQVDKLSDSGTGVTGVVNLNSGGGNSASQVAGAYGTVNAVDGYYGYVYGTRGLVNTSGTAIDWAYGAHGRVVGTSVMTASYGLWGESQAENLIGSNYGGQAQATWIQGASVSQNIGLRARSAPVSGVTTQVTNSYGLIAQGRNGSSGTWGVLATASSTGTTATTWGIYASGANAGTNFGIYATATGGTSTAGSFIGDIWVSGTPSSTAGGLWAVSDAALKTDPQPITNASELLLGLQPKTYSFLTEQYPHMRLPEGTQPGFYAQELEQILPLVVGDAVHPAQYDSTGIETAPAINVKTVNYSGIIPYLVAAFQEQQATIDDLQEQLSACCAMDGGQRYSAPATMASDLATDLRSERLSIAPNPFTTSTTLRYFMAQEGRARLEVSADDGRLIEVLREERTSAGEHSYSWNTSDLSAGTYFVAFIVDDNTIVKRAVKVNER